MVRKNESLERAAEMAAMLAPAGRVTIVRMFGGAALRLDGVQFGLVISGTLYLRVDDASRPAFAAAGSRPFSYTARGRTVSVASYYEAPEALFDDEDELALWVRRACAAYTAAPKPRKRRNPAEDG